VCGIAGSVGEHASRDDVEAQLRLLDHRGPDSSGVFAAGAGVIGQTRLAVIDLVTGDPPMTSEDGAIGAVLNGEIYNFRRLRKELLDAGHALRSEGDTEVLAHLAEDHEPAGLAHRLDGMFAFAVWDARRRRLVLGRDRLGKKPLYYAWQAGTLVFASEIKALVTHPLVARRLDPSALAPYLMLGYVPTPRTFFGEGGEPELVRYWQLRPPTTPHVAHTPLRSAARQVQAGLRDAVSRRLVSDVPLGAFLSGGVDSSSVVALMSELATDRVATFTIGFDDQEGFDERPYARLVAERFRTDHTEFVVAPDASQLVERLVWHHDQPFGDSSALPTFLLSELTRRHVTVALCGDGGDELFAGYERFAAAAFLDRLRRLPRPVREGISRAAGALPSSALAGRAGSVQRLLARRDLPVHEAFLEWVSFVPRPWRGQLLAGEDGGLPEGAVDAWEAAAGGDLLDRLQRFTLATYLLDDLLPKVDRMAMAHGLEVRSPFLDTALVELAFSLPSTTKQRGPFLKRVLKAAMADVLPREILHRRKRGFGLPLDRWFRNDLRPFVDARLGDPSARVRAHLDGKALDRLLAEHHAGASHGHALWTLLTLEVFLRKEEW
jgi:asparagine synthase (glutamine-hydrolysing)